VSPVQLAGAQVTVAPSRYPAQVFASTVPAHVRLLQISPPPSSHGARSPRGTPSTGVQVPNFPETSQASHWPSQAVSQHTPSTQKPVAHSGPLSHALPRFFLQTPGASGVAHELPTSHSATPQQTPSVQNPVLHPAELVHGVPRSAAGAHAPDLQKKPLVQSPSPAQVVLQVVAPHAKAPHDFVVALQPPAASHVPDFDSMPSTQPSNPHDAEGPGAVHLVRSRPSQRTPHGVPAPGPLQAGRLPRGAPTAGLQTPSLPGTSHASH
jgi:hypothetical protein